MKRILLGLSLLIAYTAMAQTNGEVCKTAILHERMMQQDPQYRLAIEKNEQKLQEYIQSHPMAIKSGTVYTIPIVVHVIHLGESVGNGTNISDDQIHSAIDNLTDAYRNYNYNGVDVEIEFRLAARDELDQPHCGINRVDGSGTCGGGDCYGTMGITDNNETIIKALSKWSNTGYYNIWIVSEIDNNGGGSGTQGYAYYPGASSSVDGAVILYNSFGYDPNGTMGYTLKSSTNYNATTIHELGHGLNLKHTFEGDSDGTVCPSNSNCSTEGDLVCDTDPHIRSDSDCDVINSTCHGVSNSTVYNNFMAYSSDDCQDRFTAGQSTRMRSALTTSRPGLISSNGATAAAAPIVDFRADVTTICTGTAVTFYDRTCQGDTAWNWTFSGGTPSSSSSESPSVTYNTAGSYNVSLQVFNPSGNDIETKVGYIEVYDAATAASCTNGIQNSGYFGYAISNVTLNTIDNSSSVTQNGYNDNSCSQITQLTPGQQYTISIDVEADGGQDAFHAVYIDYNNNGTFDLPDEEIASGSLAAGNTATTFNYNFTPTNPVTGTLLRMRVINDQFDLSGPCDNLFTGESEDYGIYFENSCGLSSSGTVTNATCNGSADGSVNLSVSGGTSPYAYTWNNGSSSEDINGLSAGTYAVTVTDNAACTSTSSFNITQPNMVSASASTTNDTGSNDGSATASVSGGTPGYTYQWSNGGNTATINNLGAGTYTVTVTDSNGCTGTGSGNVGFNTGVDSTQLASAYCGYSASTISDIIACDAVVGATAYEFRFEHSGSGFSASHIKDYQTLTKIKLTHIPGIQYGVTYDVQVRAYVNGSWGSYGDVCQVTTPANVANTQLSSAYCSYSASALADIIAADQVNGATAYEFRFEHSGSGFSQSHVKNYGTYHKIKINHVPGVQYGLTYDVQVRAYVNNTWGNYGNVCQITTPSGVSSTQLTSSYCSYSASSLNDIIAADVVSGATAYEFRFEHSGSGFSESHLKNYKTLNKIKISHIPNVQNGVTYDVQVRAYVNGTWGTYGPICQITTPGVAKKGENAFEYFVDNDGTSPITELVVYPNPSDGQQINVQLNGNLSQDSEAFINVYDMFGRVVYGKRLTTTGNEVIATLNNDGKIASGLYILKVTIDGQEFHEKVVVR